MTRPARSLDPFALVAFWRAFGVMLVACARRVAHRKNTGAADVLQQVERVELAVRTAQVMLCQKLAELPPEDNGARCPARAHLRTIAVMLLCLAAFLQALKLTLRASPVWRQRRFDARGARGRAQALATGDAGSIWCFPTAYFDSS